MAFAKVLLKTEADLHVLNSLTQFFFFFFKVLEASKTNTYFAILREQ